MVFGLYSLSILNSVYAIFPDQTIFSDIFDTTMPTSILKFQYGGNIFDGYLILNSDWRTESVPTIVNFPSSLISLSCGVRLK